MQVICPDEVTAMDKKAGELRISVVIPTKNEGHRIRQTLEALRVQTLQPFEVVVVDARSRDGTVAVAESYGARVLYESYGTRAGGCQVGVEAARGDLVAFTDADCVPDPDWLQKLAARMTDGVAGVGGRIVNHGESFWEQSIDAALDTLIGSANSVQGRPFTTSRSVPSISGCNSLYRRQELLDVGGFRTDLVTTEDTELNRRVRTRGTLLYTPDAIVQHRHQRDLKAFAKRMYQYGYGRGQSLLVDPPLLAPLAAPLLIPLLVFLPIVAYAILVIYAIGLGVSAAGAAVKERTPRYLASIPLILVIEHVCYAAGAWVGIWRTRVKRQRRNSRREDQPS